jgi:hypothetical protein
MKIDVRQVVHLLHSDMRIALPQGRGQTRSYDASKIVRVLSHRDRVGKYVIPGPHPTGNLKVVGRAEESPRNAYMIRFVAHSQCFRVLDSAPVEQT